MSNVMMVIVMMKIVVTTAAKSRVVVTVLFKQISMRNAMTETQLIQMFVAMNAEELHVVTVSLRMMKSVTMETR
jgi:hypothetical protein